MEHGQQIEDYRGDMKPAGYIRLFSAASSLKKKNLVSAQSTRGSKINLYVIM